ncbi:hypothetical protein QR680_016112 [Steinernema hermaphroditum]|uniref:Uncharacterized protein n=1 Tax=Steinernema hermaphroditum TaxID=289476 RepID=A0AA39HCM3_9BILA|nr:hypothetical protein QR680_016112 [Steinernema hermaphroditum]
MRNEVCDSGISYARLISFFRHSKETFAHGMADTGQTLLFDDKALPVSLVALSFCTGPFLVIVVVFLVCMMVTVRRAFSRRKQVYTTYLIPKIIVT